MRIAIGSDHGGFTLKAALIDHLKQKGHSLEDLGCFSKDPVDYPDLAAAVANAVAEKRVEVGIMIDGAGVGSTMAANKVAAVRAALCNDIYTAGNAREHNNANMLVMGSMVVGTGKALQIADKFLDSHFQGGRHQRRVDKIDQLDRPASIDNRPDDLANIVQSVVRNLMNPGTASSALPDQARPLKSSAQSGLITESILRDLLKTGQTEVALAPGTVVTPLARDFARDKNIRFTR